MAHLLLRPANVFRLRLARMYNQPSEIKWKQLSLLHIQFKGQCYTVWPLLFFFIGEAVKIFVVSHICYRYSSTEFERLYICCYMIFDSKLEHTYENSVVENLPSHLSFYTLHWGTTVSSKSWTRLSALRWVILGLHRSIRQYLQSNSGSVFWKGSHLFPFMNFQIHNPISYTSLDVV